MFNLETTRFGFRFGTPFDLDYRTTAGAFLGRGPSIATATVTSSIIGIYVLDANGRQVTEGLTVTSSLGGTYGVIATTPNPIAALPHVAVGETWTTTLTVINTGQQNAEFEISFYDDAGSPLALPLIAGTSSRITGVVPPHSTSYFVAMDPSSPIHAGWAQITSDPAIVVHGLFRNQVLGIYYEAGVSLTTGGRSFVVPFDFTAFAGEPLSTGFAMSNLEPTAAAITCTARDDGGSVIANAVPVSSLRPLGHWADYRFPVLWGRRGTIACVSSTNVSALGIRILATGAFTTLPVVMK